MGLGIRPAWLLALALAIAPSALARWTQGQTEGGRLVPSRPQERAAANAEKAFRQLADQAGRAQRAGESEEAIRLYLEALQIRPQWAEGWRNLGVLLSSLKDYKRAQTAFQNLVQAEPKSGDGWALLGLCEFEQGRYDDSLKRLVHARRLGMQNADLQNLAVFHEALLLIQKGEFEAAEPLLIRLARSGVADPDLGTALGLDALRIPTLPDKLNPDQQTLVNRVGAINLQGIHDSVDQASSAYEKLLAEQPRTLGLHYAYGDLLLGANKLEPAIEQMQQELELNPNDLMAMLQIAMTNLTLSRPDQSLPYAQKAVRLAPKLFASHLVLGRVFFRLGQDNSAISELEEAAKLAPQSPEVHYSLSAAYTRVGRKSDAIHERQIFAQLKNEEGQPGTPASVR